MVLMDINLAGEMDGIEAAAQIQAQLDIGVIYLTGYPEDVLPQETKATERHAYLSKPVCERELRAAIEMVLSKHEAGNKPK